MFGTREGHFGNIGRLDAAIYFKRDATARFSLVAIELFTHGTDLVERRADEALPAKAGIHAHEQHHVNAIELIVEISERSCRIKDETGLHAAVTDELQGAVDMPRRLAMERDDVGACLREGGHELVNGLDHQMHVHGHPWSTDELP